MEFSALGVDLSPADWLLLGKLLVARDRMMAALNLREHQAAFVLAPETWPEAEYFYGSRVLRSGPGTVPHVAFAADVLSR